jgi:hypothetical protein
MIKIITIMFGILLSVGLGIKWYDQNAAYNATVNAILSEKCIEINSSYKLIDKTNNGPGGNEWWGYCGVQKNGIWISDVLNGQTDGIIINNGTL